MKRIFILLIICSLFFCSMNAQIHFQANVANNHLWRGMEVADGMVFTSDISITDKNEYFRIGLWGGTNTSGTYKEFNHYVSFTYRQLNLSVWDTYNFSPGATYNNKEYFNYSAHSTGRFIDATLSYRFGKQFPLFVTWSTILFGRDRNTSNTANKYSTFVYVEYPIYQNKGWNIDTGIGGAFALNEAGNDSHFYGNSPGIVHAALKISKHVVFKEYKIPVYACMMWNPQRNNAFFQIGIQLFKF